MLLKMLYNKKNISGKLKKKEEAAKPEGGYQLSFIQLDDPTLLEIRDKLLDIDIDSLTPLEALLKLNEIKKLVGNARFSVVSSEWYENNPLSVIEAQCLGTPVLGASI